MPAMSGHPFGIDFGGSGIKGAPVDLGPGDFAADRVQHRHPATVHPAAVAAVFAELLGRFPDSDAPVGVTVPARRAPRRGRVGGQHRRVVGRTPTRTRSSPRPPGRDVHVVNDADAAGLAEARYGAARGRAGLVIVTTLGTGIGSAIIFDGVLVPNSELGHLEVDGHDAESRAANSVREREDLSWEEWAERLTVYYRAVEALFSPDLFVVGGGVSKHAAEFLPLIDVRRPRWCRPPCATGPASSAPPSTRPRQPGRDAAVVRPGQPRSLALTASGENSWSTTSRVSPTMAASSPSAPSCRVRWRVARGSDSL